MALSDVLNNLTGARDALVTAINNKGGSVAASATLRQCADAVTALPEGGGSSGNDPVFDGLIFYLSFDRWMTDSISDLKIPFADVEAEPGKNDLCGHFDGRNSWAAIPKESISVRGKSEWSVGFWFKPEQLTQTVINPVYAEWNETSYGSARFSVQLTNDLKVFSQVNFTDGQEAVDLLRAESVEALSIGTWYFVVVSVNLTVKQMVLYVNGTAMATSTNEACPEFAPSSLPYNDIQLMNWFTGETNPSSGGSPIYETAGSLDEFAFWGRALSADEVAALYNSGAGLFYENNTNSVGGTTSADLIDLIERDITSIEIPEGTTEIGDRAFSQCSSLNSVSIPDGVTKISQYAFSGCTSLVSVVIPHSVTTIENSAFSSCFALDSLIILPGVTDIGSSAFSICTSLTSVVIPNSVTKIGISAFAGCRLLASVTIPDSVLSIGNGAFNDCDSLADIYCGFAENAVSGAPWGAPETATIHYNA